MPTRLLTPKITTLFGTWTVRTMYEAGKAPQIAAGYTRQLGSLQMAEPRTRLTISPHYSSSEGHCLMLE